MMTLGGCQLSMVSDIVTESHNGMTIQHSIYFDDVTEINDGNITGYKFVSKGVSGHNDYGWVLCINPGVSDISDLQEKVRVYTEANMTNRWSEERNSDIDGILTMQGSYEGISPNMQGFASYDTVADKYNTQIYAVTEDGYTKVLILAINNSVTQLNRDETALMQGTLSLTEDFVDSTNGELDTENGSQSSETSSESGTSLSDLVSGNK